MRPSARITSAFAPCSKGSVWRRNRRRADCSTKFAVAPDDFTCAPSGFTGISPAACYELPQMRGGSNEKRPGSHGGNAPAHLRNDRTAVFLDARTPEEF